MASAYNFFLISINLSAQNCTILSKATISLLISCVLLSQPREITYTGVNDAGTPVDIRIDWDNGTVVTVPLQGLVRVFSG